MFDSSSIIVGLEIGTSKICAIVGEVSDDGALNLVGIGQSPSRGVRKGEIVDAHLVEEDVRKAIAEAEQMADVEIRSVYLGVTGAHICGFNNRGVHPVVSADREITEDDVEDVVKNSKAINLPSDSSVIHAVRQHFLVDGHEGIANPVGMLGSRLEVDVHVVHGNLNRLQNAIRVVKGMQLEVDEVVFTGLAASLAVLTPEQKELGCLVIDLGGGTTDYVVYVDGVVRHSGVLAVGGDHVSNDLKVGLKVSMSRAEELKVRYGGAFVEEKIKGEVITLTNAHGFPEKSVNHEHLRRIMSLRLEEIFELIAEDLEQAGLTDYLRGGALLCGGSARVPNLCELAERALQMSVTIGKTTSISSMKSQLDQPEFAAPIGLVKFGSYKARKREAPSPVGKGIKKVLNRFLQR
ncbi:MAG: cell division protein FtsA [Verrucomicrobia bacterium]|nr:MAG: cell division protein FtsA [Verrucomicrobiota bacterium]